MVSIIIPTVDRHECLVKLVESIDRQQFDRNRLEILIVYNLPRTKRRGHILQPSRQGVRVLHAPFQGVNHARNAGILAARGNIILFIDDDCVMDDPLYIQKIYQRHQENPQMMALGGPYELSQNSSFWDRAYHANMTLWMKRQRISPTRSRALLGGNASYKSVIFEKGRRFTPGIPYGGSETPFNELLFEEFGPHGFYEDLALTHRSSITARDFMYKAYKQGRGFAELSKRTPQNIEGPLDTSSIPNGPLKCALHFYSFVFMVGFRTSIYERSLFFTSLVEEIWQRMLRPWRRLSLTTGESLKVSRSYRDLR